MAKDEEEYREEWKDGNSVRRNFYRFGQWKLLELNALPEAVYNQIAAAKDFNYWALNRPTSYNSSWCSLKVQLKMTLVAKGVDPLEGENGYAPTTWISAVYINNGIQQYGNEIDGITYNPNWEVSLVRAFLKGLFTSYIFPQDLKNYVRRVIKYTTMKQTSNVLDNSAPTVDWFWIPSFREIFGGCSDIHDLDGLAYIGKVDPSIEMTGPIYDIFCTGTYEETVANRIFTSWNEPDAHTGIATRTNINVNIYGNQRSSIYINESGKFGCDSAGYGNQTIGFCL